jgi:glucose/arabinose dehydrogenase
VAAPSAAPVRSASSGSVATGFDPGRIQLELERAWAGLSKPLGLVHAGDDSGRVFVLEQGGLIKVVENGQLLSRPFLDLTGQVSPIGPGYSERGLLGLAFHPRFRANGLFFVNYTDRRGDTQVVRYRASPADRNVADPASAMTILTQPQPYANHNGGHLAFGPDGYLYIGLGDGGSANDPQGNGQNLATWLGKLLRIDVDGGEPYAIPPDNPFRARAGARPEVWAYGLRNPWRYSFDRATGDLYIADVGQNAWEEIDVQPAGSPGGENYGWNLMEGAHCRAGVACDRSGLSLPVAEYGRSAGCSVTGGYVYRGSAQPGLVGAYVYGDYCSGRVWGLARGTAGSWRSAELLQAPHVQLSSFGEDEAGEVYLTSLGEGVVYRLVARGR